LLFNRVPISRVGRGLIALLGRRNRAPPRRRRLKWSIRQRYLERRRPAHQPSPFPQLVVFQPPMRYQRAAKLRRLAKLSPQPLAI
jgi:hypothetical protein